MTTYRTGNHWGVTIVRENPDPERFCCNRGDHPGHSGDQLVAVVVNGDRALAERICRLLNDEDADRKPGCPYCATGLAVQCPWHSEPPDSCTCTVAKVDPHCPVHHGRRARGPKPANPPGCICDGSGRTCPRHGAVL